MLVKLGIQSRLDSVQIYRHDMSIFKIAVRIVSFWEESIHIYTYSSATFMAQIPVPVPRSNIRGLALPMG